MPFSAVDYAEILHVIFRHSVRTNECLKLIAGLNASRPSSLTSLLIFQSSVIFGLSAAPGSSEVKFRGCNQCLSEAGQSRAKVISRHCWGGRKPRLIQVSVLFTHQFTRRGRCWIKRRASHQHFMKSLQLCQDQWSTDVNYLYAGKYRVSCIAVYLLGHKEFSTQENKNRITSSAY